MENLHKVVYWFENTRTEVALASRLDGELVGIANSMKNDFFQPSDTMFTSSKLALADWNGVDQWEWYGKIAIDGNPGDFSREAGTTGAADEMASRILTSLEGDPFTVGTPVRVS